MCFPTFVENQVSCRRPFHIWYNVPKDLYVLNVGLQSSIRIDPQKLLLFLLNLNLWILDGEIQLHIDMFL